LMPLVVSILPREHFQTANVDFPSGWDFKFLNSYSEDEIIAACRGADFLLAHATFPLITERVLQNIPSVRFIQIIGAGYDQINISAAARLNLPVANVPGENATAVAEYIIGVIFILQRRIIQADREVKAGNYSRISQQLMAAGLREIRNTRLGLIGLGAIGRQVARLARLMGASVSYYKPHRAPEREEAEMEVDYKPMDELLSTSEVISLHVPLNGQTRGMIGSREFKLMRPGALFVNTARGEIVDQDALAKALESGRLGGVAIDTMSPEPPLPDHPLLKLSPEARNRILLTPHIAGVTIGALGRMLRAALANMARVAAGEPANYVVNGINNSTGGTCSH
ncbi:MAG: 2-hydroxyacid dehydrogenase, partial [Firmicutes bacterium]|nr:2-hydroxyacid dehydrogenase [Bacillota bacterium]